MLHLFLCGDTPQGFAVHQIDMDSELLRKEMECICVCCAMVMYVMCMLSEI